jgi:hypothetical protein
MCADVCCVRMERETWQVCVWKDVRCDAMCVCQVASGSMESSASLFAQRQREHEDAGTCQNALRYRYVIKAYVTN